MGWPEGALFSKVPKYFGFQQLPTNLASHLATEHEKRRQLMKIVDKQKKYCLELLSKREFLNELAA